MRGDGCCLRVVDAAGGIVGTRSIGLDRDTAVKRPRRGRVFEPAVLNNSCRVASGARAGTGAEEEGRKGESKRLALDHD